MNWSEAEVSTRKIVALIAKLSGDSVILDRGNDFDQRLRALEVILEASRELRITSSELFEFLDAAARG